MGRNTYFGVRRSGVVRRIAREIAIAGGPAASITLCNARYAQYLTDIPLTLYRSDTNIPLLLLAYVAGFSAVVASAGARSMIDLTKCAVERLRADDTFILYRAHRPDGARSLLALVPRQPTISSLEKLKNEYALAGDLDPACAVLPIELVPHKESMMLSFEDPAANCSPAS
jgi:hypothetical protein